MKPRVKQSRILKCGVEIRDGDDVVWGPTIHREVDSTYGTWWKKT